jgi:hypothetical protein
MSVFLRPVPAYREVANSKSIIDFESWPGACGQLLEFPILRRALKTNPSRCVHETWETRKRFAWQNGLRERQPLERIRSRKLF